MTKDFIPGKPAVTPAATSASGRKGEASETQLSPHSGVETDVSSVAIDGSVLAMTTWPGVRQESLSPEGLTDAQVMVRVREGDEAAFDYLIQKYRRPIIGFMYRMVHNAGAAEDLAQEVFLRVYRSRASYEPSAKFTTWLYRIATNLAVNYLRDSRHERPENVVSLDEPDEETGTTMDVADKSATVEQAMVARERLNAIRQKVQELPERQRTAVIMHKYQQMDYRQIAEVLKLSESATKSLLFRAYESLRVQLKDFI